MAPCRDVAQPGTHPESSSRIQNSSPGHRPAPRTAHTFFFFFLWDYFYFILFYFEKRVWLHTYQFYEKETQTKYDFFIGKGFSQLSICDSASLFSGSQYLSVENTLGKASLGCITHIHISKIITIVLKGEFSDLSFLCRSLHLCPPSFCTSISYSFLTEVTEIKGLLWLIIQESPTF